MDDAALPTYQRKRPAVRVLAVVIVLLLVVPLVFGLIYQQALAPKPPPPVEVVVDNQSDATYIVWGNTDPVPVPSGSDYLLARYGFKIAPHTVAELPRDRGWGPVEIWTVDCVAVTEEAAPETPGLVVTIDSSGTVSLVARAAGLAVGPATPTDACKLEPWTPDAS
jgi:hypothetical protein